MLSEEVRWILDVAILLLGGLGGYILQTFHKRLETIEDRFEKLPETYARRDDVTGGFDRMYKTLERIELKLDRKVDKSND